jgi:hypothetical protein
MYDEKNPISSRHRGGGRFIVLTSAGAELAKKTQNPVADLISVPLQSNFNFGAGSRDKMIYLLNVKPVIPIKIADD